MPREGEAEPIEYDTLLQDLVDLSRDSDSKQEEITEQKKALVDADKQKALVICDIKMKNLRNHKVLKNDPSFEKQSRRSAIMDKIIEKNVK